MGYYTCRLEHRLLHMPIKHRLLQCRFNIGCYNADMTSAATCADLAAARTRSMGKKEGRELSRPSKLIWRISGGTAFAGHAQRQGAEQSEAGNGRLRNRGEVAGPAYIVGVTSPTEVELAGFRGTIGVPP